MKKPVIVIAALFFAAFIFGSGAVTESRAVEKKGVASGKVKKGKTVKKAGAKKRGKKSKREQVVMGDVDQRKAALKACFQRAGIGENDIDGIFADERLEIYHRIYERPPLKPGEKRKKKLSYFDEEFGLLKPESIEAGKRVIADNRELFENLKYRYGVPPNYIVSIIRIETDFNKHLGKYRVFNALYTMSLLDRRAKRVAMANRELIAWVKLCKRRNMDIFETKGSWAGAFGIPQFMPSSYVIFAVDYDGDGKADLYTYPDAFASIANYLSRMGWQTGNERKMRRAVYSYNHEKAYVNAVFAYAERI